MPSKKGRVVMHANRHDLPVYYVKRVDHWNGAERGIEIKDGGTPLAIDYMPVDFDALYRREKSGENRTNCGCPLNWRANRSHKLDIFVKWRTSYILRPKPVQVRFNSTNHVVPHEKLHLQIVTAGNIKSAGESGGPILQ